MSIPQPLHTPRLKIVPATAELAQAAVSDRARFASLLGAAVTEQWPPEVLADVEALFAGKLAEHPDQAGWFGWYAIAKEGPLVSTDTLAASVGCWPPDDQGLVMFGYSVLPAFEGRGLGTEAARALVSWLEQEPRVRLLRADSFEGNIASCRILVRCGLALTGVSPDDATAPDSDRKGRGRLLRYERRIRP